jgi:hypothetical protein
MAKAFLALRCPDRGGLCCFGTRLAIGICAEDAGTVSGLRLPGAHSGEHLSERVTVGADAGLGRAAAFLVERASDFH